MIKHLIFSGCSTKFFSLIGCLRCLEDYNILNKNNIENIHCSSGSVLILILYLIGYNLKEIKEIVYQVDLDTFCIDTNNKDAGEDIINNILFKKSLLNNDKFKKLVSDNLKKKLGVEDLTFKELYELSGINLIVNTFCFDKNELQYFSYKDSPNMSVVTGILMTISIPIIIEPVVYNNMTYCDAGIIRHYDFEWFKDLDGSLKSGFNKNEILGIIINSIHENYKTNMNLINNCDIMNNLNELKIYLKSILDIMTCNYDYKINDINYIDIKFNLEFYELSINNHIKNKLIIFGYKKTLDYLKIIK